MDRLNEIIDIAERLNLSGVELFKEIGPSAIRKAYNGIGPEFFPEELRAKMTEWLALFEPAAIIHDLRFGRSDGERWAFNFANDEFLANCRVCADDAYSWYNWRRYRARLVARLLHDFVRGPAGWKAWRDANEQLAASS